MFVLKKWSHRLLPLSKWKSDSRSGFSQNFDSGSGSGSERKTQNPAEVDSGNPDPVPPLIRTGSDWIRTVAEVAGVTFSDSNSAPVPKLLNPNPEIFQIWESDSCSDSGYNHWSNRNLHTFLLKKWPHRPEVSGYWFFNSWSISEQIFAYPYPILVRKFLKFNIRYPSVSECDTGYIRNKQAVVISPSMDLHFRKLVHPSPVTWH